MRLSCLGFTTRSLCSERCRPKLADGANHHLDTLRLLAVAHGTAVRHGERRVTVLSHALRNAALVCDPAGMKKLVAALVTAALFTSAALAQSRKPNVVLILTDDQGTLDAGCYGSTDLHTPAIDSLAADGVRFTQAYSHTVCCPTRPMLLTGRQPQRGNVNDWMQGPINGPKGNNMCCSRMIMSP